MKIALVLFVAVALPSCFGFSIRSVKLSPQAFSTNCNRTLTARIGNLTSPGYPGQYPNKQDCRNRITAAAGKTIKITFTKFSLENGYDYLEIIDGSQKKSYTGSNIPSPYTSKTNTVVIRFKSDYSVRQAGFALTYRIIDGCSSVQTAASGVVSSPGFPGKYPHKQNCITNITVQSGKRVQLTFLSFSVEPGSSCTYDYLKIIDGSNVKTLCGNTLPSKFISKSNSISLRFKSDSSVTDDGYQARYMAVDAPPPPTPSKVNEAFCGDVKASQSRVIGGTNATKGSWPWQIGMFSKYGRFFCGGSIISPDWVVTASHCVDGDKPGDISIKAGDWDLNNNDGTEQKVDVEKIIMHPKYNLRGKINYDIALLKLKTPVLLNNFVNTVCIPAKTSPIAVNSTCYITGWGKIKHPGSSHPILQQAVLPVVDTNVCQTKLDKMNWGMNITDVMVCAGAEGSIKSGCHGDSGGPYVCKDSATNKFVLHGAVSWGSGRCSTNDVFTVFARVQALRQWIDDQMKAN